MNDEGHKIGILGGTFNPIHDGHLRMAEYAMEQFDLDLVIFIPTGHTAYKDFSGEEMTYHRCRMVELAIEGHPGFVISRMETRKEGVNYTYLTLRDIKERLPEGLEDAKLYFIIGGDSLNDFSTWKHPELICQEAVILATARYGVDGDELDRRIGELALKYGGETHCFDMPRWTSSSREIRERIGRGEPVSDLVPAAVEEYIRENGLYRTHEI